jgi:hypothetical protein
MKKALFGNQIFRFCWFFFFNFLGEDYFHSSLLIAILDGNKSFGIFRLHYYLSLSEIYWLDFPHQLFHVGSDVLVSTLLIENHACLCFISWPKQKKYPWAYIWFWYPKTWNVLSTPKPNLSVAVLISEMWMDLTGNGPQGLMSFGDMLLVWRPRNSLYTMLSINNLCKSSMYN